MIGVDFTRTAQSVQRTGADLQKWAKEQVSVILFNFEAKFKAMNKI